MWQFCFLSRCTHTRTHTHTHTVLMRFKVYLCVKFRLWRIYLRLKLVFRWDKTRNSPPRSSESECLALISWFWLSPRVVPGVCYFWAQLCAVGVKIHLKGSILLSYKVMNNSLGFARYKNSSVSSLTATLWEVLVFFGGARWDDQYDFHHSASMCLV